MANDAIGGYFELELPAAKGDLYPDALCFQSARAAYLALLRAGKPKRVWMPYYICESMTDSVRQAGIEPVFYRIDRNLYLAEDIALADGDWILYVDYFGIREEYTKSLFAAFGSEKVVVDRSQALFTAPVECLAIIYSPRKFLGVPDGGLLVSSIPLELPAQVDEDSINRSTHLLQRLAFSPEEGYRTFHRDSQSLVGQDPKVMSQLTRRILATIDYGNVRVTREKNFRFLDEHLSKWNSLDLNASELAGPFCYPLLTSNGALRDYLITKRVFIARYWPEVLGQTHLDNELFLVEHLIPLPCDQRYGLSEMQRIVNICLEFLSR